MTVLKKMDQIGRLVIPRDMRRNLCWIEGDEIEIIQNDDGTVLLRKHDKDTARRLRELSADWSEDEEIEQRFADLITLIEEKTKE